MAAPSKSWVVISDAMVDADSPLDTTLMTGLRDDLVHLEEWLGMSYTAAQDHDHDGVNSKLVASVAASAVGQAQLKTTTGEVSTSSINPAKLTLPGGTYGFYPQIKSSNAAISGAATFLHNSTGASGNEMVATQSIGTSYVSNITLESDSTYTLYAQQRYIQASPPYLVGQVIWGHFLFLLRDIATGTPKAAYEAEDPPWAYNGALHLMERDPGRIAAVPHPFADYWQKDPAVDGLEIVMVDLSERNVKQVKEDAWKTGQGLLENIPALIAGKGRAKSHTDYLLPEIARFTSQVKIVMP